MIFIAADGKIVIDVILDDGSVAKGVTDINKELGGVANGGKKAALGIGKIAGALGLVAVAAKAIDILKQSLDGAIDRYDTLNSFPRVLQLMGFDAEQSQGAIDKLSDGIDGLPTTLDSVAKTTQRIATMTGDLDGAVDTTLALNNAFIASGSSVADAERGLDQYVQMLSKGEVDLESWRTLQETMPVALNETAKAFGFTGQSAQNDLYDALKAGDVTFDQFNGKVVELSNKTGGFADIARSASGGIKTSWTNIKTAVVKGVADVIGAVDEAMGGVGSIEGLLDRVKTGVKTTFNAIVAAIPIVVGAISNVYNTIKNFAIRLVETWNSMKGDAVGAFQAISDFIRPVIQSVVTFVMSIWGQLVAFWNENGQMILQAAQNVWNVIKTVITTVMNVINSVMTTMWPLIKLLIIDTWNAIKNTIQGAVDVILGIVKFFSAIFTGNWSAMWEATKQIFSGALQLVWGLINLWFVGKILKVGKVFAKGLQSIIRGLWNAIKALFKGGVNVVKNVVNAGFNFVRSLINKIMNAVKSVISSAWNSIKSTTSNLVNGIKNKVIGVWNNLKTRTGNIFRSLKNTITSPLKSINLVGIGKNIINGLISGIKSKVGAVSNAVKSVTSKITGKIKSILGIHSPSRWMRDMIGKNMMLGWQVGIDREKNSMLHKAKQMTDWMKPEEPSIGNKLKQMRLASPIGKIAPLTIGTNTITREQVQHSGGEQVIKIEATDVIMDGYKVGKVVWRPVKDNIDRDSDIKKSFRG
ncbi:phage tail protein [Virgibacillus halodenitrificans]|uniref:phage tail protein n=1 Tax=Virgibacillus halodenitrificans TaxID=1482 RepID=UPI0002D996E0|nr:tape measure protein [Virgibacillus halodenitrificans]